MRQHRLFDQLDSEEKTALLTLSKFFTNHESRATGHGFPVPPFHFFLLPFNS
jgi:hypothetical protein